MLVCAANTVKTLVKLVLYFKCRRDKDWQSATGWHAWDLSEGKSSKLTNTSKAKWSLTVFILYTQSDLILFCDKTVIVHLLLVWHRGNRGKHLRYANGQIMADFHSFGNYADTLVHVKRTTANCELMFRYSCHENINNAFWHTLPFVFHNSLKTKHPVQIC